jgi:peptide/nickel transport system substrate-binding protein
MTRTHTTDTAAIERQLRGWLAGVRDGRLSRRGFVARLSALGLTAPLAQLLLADAGHAQTPAPWSYPPTRRGGGGPLKLLMWQGPTQLNPHFTTGTKDLIASRAFYEPLVAWDAAGAMVPVLAAEVPSRANGGLSADGRTVTWKLKPGVKWHDGRPFTAEDVVFNWRYATEPATAAITSGYYDGVERLQAVDATTLRVVWARPQPFWPGPFASYQIIPRHLFEPFIGAKSRDAPNNQRPVGTGPYRFVDFRPGDMLRGEPNPDYHLPNRPHFDAFELKGGGDAVGAARAVLQTGEFDFAWNLQVEDEVLRRMESGGRGRAAIGQGGTIEHVLVNVSDPWTEVQGERGHPSSRHPILSDPAVREALALLFDRASMQRFIYGRAGEATANYLNNPAVFRSPNRKPEFNVERAAALLDAAGWKPGRGGIREKGGRRLRLVFQTSINAPRQKVQAIAKQAAQRAGIELELKSVQASVFFGGDEANPDTLNKFWADLQMFAQSMIQPDPQDAMQIYRSEEVAARANRWNGRNSLRYQDPEFDRLHESARTEMDPVKRAALFIALNDRLCGSHHVIPLIARTEVDGVGNTLRARLTAWSPDLGLLHDWYRQA